VIFDENIKKMMILPKFCLTKGCKAGILSVRYSNTYFEGGNSQ